MRNAISAAAAATLFMSALAGAAPLSTSEQHRIADAATVLREIRATPDKGIPETLWDRAACVAVIPGLKKAAFVIGGEYGKGLLSCRHGDAWSAPVFIELEKGSWGLQIGAQSVDLVLLVMNEKGIAKLFDDQVTLGGEASVAAGPVGRDARAGTDVQLSAAILSYSRAQGVFAGIDISGGVLRADKDDNTDLYGANASARDIVTGSTVAPAETQPFVDALSHKPVATSGNR